MKKKESAKARTVPSPLVDMREQGNFAPPIVKSETVVYRVSDTECLRVHGGKMHPEVHLAERPSAATTLCGQAFSRGTDVKGAICQACRAEASRLRAVIGR